MSQTLACPDVPDELLEQVTRVVELAAMRHGVKEDRLEGTLEDAEEIIALVLADRASRALPSTALAARPEEGWKPIETARAGVLLLLFEPHDMGGFIFVGALNGVWFNNLDHRIQKPTHWMPLPPAPSTPPTAGDGHD